MTTVAHAIRNSDGFKKLYDTRYVTTRGQELCAGTSVQTDWHDFGNILASPEQEEPQGGYGTGVLTCALGQALVWTWQLEWENADPQVGHNSSSSYECRIVKDWGGADPGLAGCL